MASSSRLGLNIYYFLPVSVATRCWSTALQNEVSYQFQWNWDKIIVKTHCTIMLSLIQCNPLLLWDFPCHRVYLWWCRNVYTTCSWLPGFFHVLQLFKLYIYSLFTNYICLLFMFTTRSKHKVKGWSLKQSTLFMKRNSRASSLPLTSFVQNLTPARTSPLHSTIKLQ